MVMKMEPYCELQISAKSLVWLLTAIMAALLAAHVMLQVWHHEWHRLPWLLRQFFDVDEEDSLPTWFGASLLLLASALLFLIARRKRADRDPWTRHWYGLSLAFAVLSMDEVAGLHETLNTVLAHPRWLFLGSAGIFALAYLPFLRHLPARTRALFVLSGCIYLGGAAGIEFATDWYEDNDLLKTLAYNLWNALEEGMEMGGVVLFIYAMLAYMGQGHGPRIDVTVTE